MEKPAGVLRRPTVVSVAADPPADPVETLKVFRASSRETVHVWTSSFTVNALTETDAADNEWAVSPPDVSMDATVPPDGAPKFKL